MNWLFFDFVRWDYDVNTPLSRPLGGSQSAMCYLAKALARRGETVTMLTGTTTPRVIDCVRCLPHVNIPRELFSPPDTITVVLNGPAGTGVELRQAIPRNRLLVLWTQHAHDQPAVLQLTDPRHLQPWDRIVCISQWQRAMYHQQLGVPLERIDILHNAISPIFERLFTTADELAAAKAGPPRLAYTSTPFRGLDVLLDCFPEIYRRHPDCRLEVYSSMQVYGQSMVQDPNQALYARCRATPGINYRGSLSQPALAKELRGASILAYPNTFAETSCIAAMEALAAGLQVVSSDLGALPETCAGWATLIKPIGVEQTRQQFAFDFVTAVDDAIRQLKADPAAFFRRRFEQASSINASCRWDLRAEEWQAAGSRWLSSFQST